jgi:hypothetical protein
VAHTIWLASPSPRRSSRKAAPRNKSIKYFALAGRVQSLGLLRPRGSLDSSVIFPLPRYAKLELDRPPNNAVITEQTLEVRHGRHPHLIAIPGGAAAPSVGPVMQPLIPVEVG